MAISATTYGSLPVDDSNGSTSRNASSETTPLITNNNNNVTKNPLKEKQHNNLLSKLIFQWFVPVLERGNEKKKLDQEDLALVPLPDDCTTAYVISTFDLHWEHELSKSNPSLVRALYLSFGDDFVRAGLLKFIHDSALFVGPQVLHAMIVFLRDPHAPMWHGFALTVAVTVSQIAMSLCLRHYFFKLYNTGLRLRTAVVMAIYRKALVLSAAERQSRTVGEITNLTSIDAQRLQDLTTYLHSLWSSPLQISLALFFLFRQLGPSSLGGVAIICFMIPVTKQIAQFMGSMQKRLMTARDERVELNSEVLSGMKVIKLQAWEEPFQARLLEKRAAELRRLFHYYIGSSCTRLLWSFTPLLVAVSTFATYVRSGHQLEVASALTALALFDILRFPLFMLPQVINNTVEAGVSLNRIQSFLLCKEYVAPSGSSDNRESSGVVLQSVTAAYDSKNSEVDPVAKELAEKDWEVSLLRTQLHEAERRIRELAGRTWSSIIDEEQSTEPFAPLCLKRVDLECKAGELIAVIGGVGCGKSSVLAAILGELRKVSGSVSVSGKLAYHSQTPFIMNATVRDNILFGHVDEPVNEELYQRALTACALRHDLELLSHGDETEIGEKGVTLSGGQKARVALARAVYHGADITLIDDALSAVDAHVAEHLFEQAIVGELMEPVTPDGKPGHRSVILVTNALQFLRHPKVSRIAVIQDGRIVEQGSYTDLANRKESVFSRFLAVIAETGISSSVMDCKTTAGAKLEPAVTIEESLTLNGESDTRPKDAPKTGVAKTMTEETRVTGHVSFNVYVSWAKAAGGVFAPVLIVLAFGCGEAMQVLSNWFLTYWSGHGDSENQIHFLAIYATIGVSVALVGALRSLVIIGFGLIASRRLFADLLATVLHAPMSFFDTTPVGRLVNRFSKDIFTIDEQLNTTLSMYLQTLFSVFSTIVVITGVTPVFSLCLIPMILFYIYQQHYFTITYRELKRIDSVNRSPLYALLGESVDGVAVIRSFGAQPCLIRRLTRMLDRQQQAYFLTCAAQSWLAVRLELIGTLVITFACLSAVLENSLHGADATFAGLAGLAISYSLSVTQSLNWSVRMASDMEANMVAVERVREYTMIESEGERHTPTDAKLPSVWPTHGLLEIRDAKMRYRPGLPLVLKGLSLSIPAGSKVGVVGRTGAGKSTLMVALLRIVELDEGAIYIDGQDIRTVGLSKLRSSIAVIPQDPVLYSGTVRTNLDPFTEYSNDKLYECLERVGLCTNRAQGSIGASTHSSSSLGRSRVESLNDVVTEGGGNFSVGQRQLLVIARALLHGSTIVIMDEATASVDAETDAVITECMRQNFATATVITVAHRLNTIMGSDYILVMSDGVASEFDSPKKLLEQGGLFRELVRAAATQD